MRAIVTVALALVLFAAPTGAQTQSQGSQAGSQSIFLLVPDDKMSDFRQAVPQSLAQDIATTSQPLPLTVEGKQYRLVGLPADRLDDLHQAINGTPVHQDMKLLLSFGHFMNVADLSSLERAAVAGGQTQTMTPSRQQTSMTGMPSMMGFPSDHVALIVPADKIADLQLPAGSDIMVVMPLEQFNRVAGITTGSASASTSASPSRQPTSATGSTSTQSQQSSTTYSTSAGTTAGRSAAPGQSMANVQGEVKQLRRDIATVSRISPAPGGQTILLEDGRNLFLPSSVQVRGAALEPGSHLSGTYIETQDGRNIITSLETEGVRSR